MNIRKIDETGFSRDYKKLWEAAKTSSQICVCDYEPKQGSFGCRDICHTIYDGETVQVSARGIGYIEEEDAEDFENSCKLLDLTWMDRSPEVLTDVVLTDECILELWRSVKPFQSQDDEMVIQVGEYDIDVPTLTLKNFTAAVANYVKRR